MAGELSPESAWPQHQRLVFAFAMPIWSKQAHQTESMSIDRTLVRRPKRYRSEDHDAGIFDTPAGVLDRKCRGNA